MTRASEPETTPEAWPAGREIGLAALYYAVCAVLATWPVVSRITTSLPSSADPIQHLWIMRWYKTCLLEARSPFFCPEIQFPTGAPLAFFSPMHLQSALYVALSFLIGNDVLIYNLIWFLGFLTTGLGTFVLAWTMLGRRSAALLAGLLAMLSTPVMIHSVGHLELIYLGGVPLFLACWIRLLDRPSWSRLLAASGTYLLATMCAAYYALLVIVPAGLYAIWALTRCARGGYGPLRASILRRSLSLAGFTALTLPGVALLFGAQLWGTAHGYSLERSEIEFESFGSPLWSYVVPTFRHALGQLVPFPVHLEAGHGAGMIETASYLGIVAFLLGHRTLVQRISFPNRLYWWTGLAALVVLSIGAHARIGSDSFDMPSFWLWRWFQPFRLIRMPVRFNLLAVVFAAVIAGAGYRHLEQARRRRTSRGALFAATTALVVADLAFLPYFEGFTPPPMPEAYRRLRESDPRATILDAPTTITSGADAISALACYWQSHHGLTTSAGYSGIPNPGQDDRIFQGSPFSFQAMSAPEYLRQPDHASFGIIDNVAFDDYAWLFLQAHDFRYLALHDHQVPRFIAAVPNAELLAARLAPALIAEGHGIRIFDRERMPCPSRPVLVCLDGWKRKAGWLEPRPCLVGESAGLAVHSPATNSRVILRIECGAIDRSRIVRLREGNRELARWEVGAEEILPKETPELVVSSGDHEWRFEVEGYPGEPPQARRLRVRRLTLIPVAESPGNLADDVSSSERDWPIDVRASRD